MIDLTAEDLSFDELVDRARGLAMPGQRRILGLTGAPGAGKSTVAGQLVDALGPALAELVPMDGFHLADEVLRAMGRRDRKGAFDTFDAAGYASLMSRIRDQTSRPGADDDDDDDDDGIVYAPRFLREIEEPIGSSIPIHPDDAPCHHRGQLPAARARSLAHGPGQRSTRSGSSRCPNRCAKTD